ncbi:MAG TPA: YgeY family selenium metabolism-linked hydrolase [bacterium]|nr:YgeY family selenium metabolism-linked hydrolase [bacterium]
MAGNPNLLEAARNLQDQTVCFLRDLIAIPSVSGDEERVIQRIKREMERLKYDRVWVDSMGNLFGQIGSGKRILVFDGHCDTVAPGSLDNWRCDPFQGEYHDGTVFGRGASDQKGGLAAAVMAGRLLKNAGLPPDVSVIVAASILEEDHEGLSWKKIIEEDRLRPEAVILTEPSNMAVRIGQRGRMEMKLTIHGVSSHGSSPELGENAIYLCSPVLQEIENLNSQFRGDSPLGKGSIAVTNIRSSAPSLCAVPDSATLHIDRRITRGENEDSCLEEIRHLPSVSKNRYDLGIPEYTVTSYTEYTVREKASVPMWLMDPSHSLVRNAVNTYQNLFGEKPEIGAWKFSTNGVTTKGIYDIPTIGFGPGREEEAHAPNESVTVEEVIQAMAFYAALALQWGESS